MRGLGPAIAFGLVIPGTAFRVSFVDFIPVLSTLVLVAAAARDGYFWVETALIGGFALLDPVFVTLVVLARKAHVRRRKEVETAPRGGEELAPEHPEDDSG